MFFGENMIRQIASYLNKDPLEVSTYCTAKFVCTFLKI